MFIVCEKDDSGVLVPVCAYEHGTHAAEAADDHPMWACCVPADKYALERWDDTTAEAFVAYLRYSWRVFKDPVQSMDHSLKYFEEAYEGQWDSLEEFHISQCEKNEEYQAAVKWLTENNIFPPDTDQVDAYALEKDFWFDPETHSVFKRNHLI